MGRRGRGVVPVGLGGAAERFRGRRDAYLAVPAGPLLARPADQPAPRAVRHPLVGPLQGRGQQPFPHGVLAGVEVAVAAHQRAEDLRRARAQQVLDGPVGPPCAGDSCGTGRSSTGSVPAPGVSAAICRARSLLPQSSREKPAGAPRSPGRPVGDHRRAVDAPHQPRLGRPVGAGQLPGGAAPGVARLLFGDGPGPVPGGEGVPLLLVAVDEQVLRTGVPSVPGAPRRHAPPVVGAGRGFSTAGAASPRDFPVSAPRCAAARTAGRGTEGRDRPGAPRTPGRLPCHPRCAGSTSRVGGECPPAVEECRP